MIYKATILLAVLMTVSSEQDLPLLGAQKCTWGPSYWCDSLENAKECGSGTEEHCRKKVWIGDHPLANKVTQPIPESGPVEKKVVGNLKVNMMQLVYKPISIPKKDGANCALCELIGKKILEKLTNNATEAEVVEEMETVCNILPSKYKDTCMEYVEEYGKMFYEAFLETADVHEMCILLGLCSQEFMRIVEETELLGAMVNGGVEGITCDTCQSLTALVQKEVLANEADIEAMLDQVCPLLPVDQKECDATVNQIFESAVQFFESYTPEEICQLVDLCENNVANAVFGIKPVEFGQEGQTGVAAQDMVF